jgi:hypothetical protein
MWILRCIGFLSFAFTVAAQAADGAGVLEHAKAASGGARWDSVRSWHGDGVLATGGLSGEYHGSVDLTTGRSVDSYKLGNLEGGDGYDGVRGWERDPGGEVAALDAPEALRRARSQAWLDARGYWFPARIAAAIGPAETKQADGRAYIVVTATPKDGDAVALWFAADSGLLARVIQRQGQDTATTLFDDYRTVDGLRLPFHSVTDLADAAGRTDARRRIDIRLERVTLDAPVADADFAMPEMTATAHIAAASGVAKIPFELINNHIYVAARIDGKPARLLVDTGGFNMLTPAAAAKFGLHGEGQLSAAGTGENRTELKVARGQSLSVGDVTLDAPVFFVVDLGKLLAVEGIEFDGLVGYEMFSRFGVQIDYAASELTIAEPARFVAPPAATVLPFELDDHIPIVAGTLDGIPIRVSVDTGSRSSLTVHSPFVKQNDLVARYGATAESVIGWGVGGAQRGYPVRLGSLTLGNQRIDGVAGELFTGSKGAAAAPDIGGNLGGGVLRRFTVAFDYAARKMYLAPNAHFRDADAFDRSGLWLLGDGDALRVADAAAGSAADRAGLRADDRITAIGGEPVAKRTLAAWRQRLRELPPGTSLDVAFVRSGTAGKVTLALADRIPPARVDASATSGR